MATDAEHRADIAISATSRRDDERMSRVMSYIKENLSAGDLDGSHPASEVQLDSAVPAHDHPATVRQGDATLLAGSRGLIIPPCRQRSRCQSHSQQQGGGDRNGLPDPSSDLRVRCPALGAWERFSKPFPERSCSPQRLPVLLALIPPVAELLAKLWRRLARGEPYDPRDRFPVEIATLGFSARVDQPDHALERSECSRPTRPLV